MIAINLLAVLLKNIQYGFSPALLNACADFGFHLMLYVGFTLLCIYFYNLQPKVKDNVKKDNMDTATVNESAIKETRNSDKCNKSKSDKKSETDFVIIPIAIVGFVAFIAIIGYILFSII